MSPPDDKNASKVKHHEIREGKQKQFFSFRWLLRKSKSSKFAKEVAQSEKRSSSNVPASKSCDTGLTTLEAVDRCPTFLLWKLLPPTGKSSGLSKISNSCSSKKLPFRSSFSCSDVHHLASSANLLSSAASTREINVTVKSSRPPSKLPSQSCYKLYRSSAGISNLDAFAKSPSLLYSDEFSAKTSQSILCKLCLVMMPAKKMFTLQDCSCMFCIMCLRQYLTINIKEGNIPITCPDAKCPDSGKILISEIKEIAGDDAFVMFERYKLNLDVDLDPARVWCPSPGCETICMLQNKNPEEGVLVHCPTCRLKFCSVCKLRWHGQVTCEEARKALSDEIELSISEDESWIKRCPNCRIPIEKDEGCAQMMCYRCKHVFCWHCLASLDDDFLLRHYDKGPCRNMLGHSRASMIWHRTQVVGIFAGFSFLLLVASPFLLLAAPCLLCCRCKSRLLYEEATPL